MTDITHGPQTTSQAETSVPTTGKMSPKFVPRFKGAAEMEARRRLRMMARASPVEAAAETGAVPGVGRSGVRFPANATSLNPELSSSDEEEEEEEEEGIPDEDEEEEEFDMVADDSLEADADEFDP